MEGENQSAKVSAARVLMDALTDDRSLEERDYRARIAAEAKANADQNREKLYRLVRDAVVGCQLLRIQTGRRNLAP
jgi:hypothetical protein